MSAVGKAVAVGVEYARAADHLLAWWPAGAALQATRRTVAPLPDVVAIVWTTTARGSGRDQSWTLVERFPGSLEPTGDHDLQTK